MDYELIEKKGIKKFKYIFFIAAFVLAVALAWYGGLKSSLFKSYESETSTVVLNKIEKVVKLVAVEGNISEIYDYKEYKNWDIAAFRKKALVRINAKVSAGFDFQNIDISVDEGSRTIYIKNFPDAQILSVDHDLDYYDITQGVFNSFTTEDYNKINSRAKEYIIQKAKESDLLSAATEQKGELLDMISFLAAGGGWKLVVEKKTILD